jgi:hypothetical protein
MTYEMKEGKSDFGSKHSITAYLSDIIRGDGAEVDAVCHSSGCLHSSNIGVDEYRLHTFFAYSFQSLQ